jgi:chaperonin GroES
MNLKPLGDKVVIEVLDSEEKTSGGILLPDTAQKKPQEGKVVAIGPGKLLDSGERAKMSVKVNDKVIFSKYGGTEVTIAGKEYTILDEDQIYAIHA